MIRGRPSPARAAARASIESAMGARDRDLVETARRRSIELLRENLTPEGILAAHPGRRARARGYGASFGRDAAVWIEKMGTRKPKEKPESLCSSSPRWRNTSAKPVPARNAPRMGSTPRI